MQPIILVVVFCLGSPLVAALDDDDTDEHWDAYKLKYNKTYDSPEDEDKARDHFENNMLHVALHNMKDENDYDKELNEFSDTPPEEAIDQLCQTIPPDDVEERVLVDFSVSERQNPSSFSWVDKGMVSRVRNQGGCGSCWAFTAAQAIESQANMAWDYRSSNNWEWVISPQQLVDCSRDFGNYGCNGGWPQSALRYVINKTDTGIVEEYNYPYEEQEKDCNITKITKSGNHFKIRGYTEVGPRGDENAVAEALAQNGPLTCAIYVSNNFMAYKSGVFFDKSYKDQGVNHGVLLVGYGTDTVDGVNQDYWLIKNSWGEDWGDKGYIKIARNRGNHLKVASYTSFPYGIYV